MADRPNILHIHSHDTGRHVQPYGHQVPTPNIQRLADQGLLLRQAFCAAPSCSGSRACLLTRQGRTCQVPDELFAELAYHAAYDPMRAIRTRRHKLIRNFGDRLEPVLPNVDDSPSKELLVRAGWGERPRAPVELYDLTADPGEMRNLAGDVAVADVQAELTGRLERWMRETADPLLDGPVPIPEGGWVNDPAGHSATEPRLETVARPAIDQRSPRTA